MESYNAKSCNALSKPFYYPIEAALRWCNLIEHEAEIVERIGLGGLPKIGDFPQWKCLRINAEKIFDALMNGEMPCGREGKAVDPDEHVAPAKRTVRHTVLKAWLAEHEPGQKPAFLFDEVERETHARYNAETFHALQAERDALKLRVDNATEAYKQLRRERDELKAAVDAQATAEKPLGTTERNTLLKLVIGMAVRGYGYDPSAARSPIPAEVSRELAALGLSMDDDTARKYLKEAAATVLPATIKP